MVKTVHYNFPKTQRTFTDVVFCMIIWIKLKKKKGGGGRWLIVQSVFTVWASDILPVLFLDWRET